MKSAIALTIAALALAGCTASATTASFSLNDRAGLEPIPGSITYRGQTRTRLTRSPIGSTLSHQFNDQYGREVHETYVIEPDRSLKIIDRYVRRERMWD
jgi:hypothetical protein